MDSQFFDRSSLVKRVARPLKLVGFFSGLLLLLSACAGPFGSAGIFGSAPTPLSGHLTVDGSTALQPLVSKAATLFQQAYPQVHIDVNGGGSVTGLNDVTSRKVDIGNSDIYADPATYPDPNLTDHLVCVIPFTMIASSDVPLTDLTKAELIDIFTTGKYTNWDQLHGPNLRIVPIVRTPTSGTRATFRRYVLGGRDELSNLVTIDSSQNVVKTVASTPGAIGYLAASVLDPQVHALSIDGSTATLQNIEAGHYTFWSYEHMYTLAGSNLSNAFLNFMLTSQVQQQALVLHYIPTSELKFSQLSSQRPATAPSTPYALAERKRYSI